MSEPLLESPRISRREYRIGPEVVRVLRGVTLTVEPGESVAVVGASGVGKSTLLHLLGTLDRPTGGRVLFAGEDVFARSEAGLARLRRDEIGFVFQFYNLLGEMSALENAMLPALLQRLPISEARARATAALGGGGARRPHGPPSRGAVRRRAAARGDRARAGGPAPDHPGR